MQQWHVELSEEKPGQGPYPIEQTITTVRSGYNKVLITDIVADD
jgi:hypothetical protein